MRRLAWVVIAMLGCESGSAPDPATPTSPPRSEPVAGTAAGSADGSPGGKDTAEDSGGRGRQLVAIGGDPCEGGEIAGGDPCGLGASGGTGEGIGLGVGGTIGHGTGTSSGYGAGPGGMHHHAHAPSVRPGAATVSGALDKDVIRRVVRRNLPRIRACYEKQLALDPAFAGKVETSFTIDASGAVSKASAKGLDGTVSDCVVAALKMMKFPRPAGGATVEVSYPFVFASDSSPPDRSPAK